MPETNQPVADLELYHEVCQFLFLEARLLDEQRSDEWYELLSTDIHYWVPARRSRYIRDAAAVRKIDTDHFDDDYESLGFRIQRMSKAGVSSLDPRPRETRTISNIEVLPMPEPDAFTVHSVVVLSRNRLLDRDEGISARREDVLRRYRGGGFKLAARKALITQNTILMANMSSLL